MKSSSPTFTASPTHAFSGMLKVLIGDSTDGDQKKLSKIFEHHEVSVTASANGNDVLKHIQEEPFDFICVSFPIDQVTDKRLFASLTSSTYNSRTPLFLFTSSSAESVSSTMHDGLVKIFPREHPNGFFDYITRLVELIRKNCFFKGRILYVEGNSSSAKSMKESLHRMGLRVTQCTSAQKAYEAFEHEDYDLVIVAIGDKSPSKDFDLIQAIRSTQGAKSQRPILAVCTSKKQVSIPEVLKKGANDYVGKLVMEEELQCRVRNLLLIKNLLEKVDSQERELRQLVMSDELTSLYSKPYLFNVGNQRANEAYRHGYPLSLILLSLDHFEQINDRYGQSIGDMVLQEMAKLVKTFSRNEDIVARTNDDEFALALPHCSEDDARAKVDRLREFVESANPSGIPVTASFGVVSLPATFPCDFEDLFSAADRAMAQAKNDGRNRAVISELVQSESGLLKVVLNQLVTT